MASIYIKKSIDNTDELVTKRLFMLAAKQAKIALKIYS